MLNKGLKELHETLKPVEQKTPEELANDEAYTKRIEEQIKKLANPDGTVDLMKVLKSRSK